MCMYCVCIVWYVQCVLFSIYRVYMNTLLTDPRDRIRLVSGIENDNIGVLQYKLDGVWGSLCSQGWTEVDATVACRLLGYPYVA